MSDTHYQSVNSRSRTIYGICTSSYSIADLDYERKRLYEESKPSFDDVVLIDTRAVTYRFLRTSERPVIEHHGRDLTTVSALHVRGRREREGSTAILAHALEYCGCHISDPTQQLPMGKATKLIGTFVRWKKKVGTDSFIAFDFAPAETMLEDLEREGYFPLLTKPIDGQHGKGVERLDTLDDALDFADEFVRMREDPDMPLFFQKFINFVHEYRVFIIDGKVLGVVEKLPEDDKITANFAQGATFVEVDAPEVARVARRYVRPQGIYGVDVGVDEHGQFHLIEANRTPQFAGFEGATRINVAQAIVESARKRVRTRKEK